MALENGAIRFERPREGWRDLTRAYKVELDGSEVGKLRRGGELTVHVAAGMHSARGAIDWTGSPALPVEVRAGEVTVVRILAGVGKPLQNIAAADTYLRIEVAGREQILS
jgi:hypothetical protein